MYLRSHANFSETIPTDDTQFWGDAGIVDFHAPSEIHQHLCNISNDETNKNNNENTSVDICSNKVQRSNIGHKIEYKSRKFDANCAVTNKVIACFPPQLLPSEVLYLESLEYMKLDSRRYIPNT